MANGEPEFAETDESRTIGWRLDDLLRAGYTGLDAVLLAMRTDVDLHGAAELLRRGCPASTALRILL